MNKFAILALLALIGCAYADQVDNLLDNMSSAELDGDEEASSAGNEGEAIPSDLPQEAFYFRDFCVNAEDEIKGFVKEKLNGAASNVYSIMLTTATDIGSEALRAHQEAVAEGTQMIQQAAESKTPETPQQIDENVDKTLENMASNPNLFQRVGSAVKSVIGVVIDTARSLFFQRLTELKDQLGTDNLRMKIDDACRSLNTELLPRVNKRMTEAKGNLKSELSDKPDLLALLNTKNPNNVGCVLSGRVWKVGKFCDVLALAGPAIYSLVGIN